MVDGALKNAKTLHACTIWLVYKHIVEEVLPFHIIYAVVMCSGTPDIHTIPNIFASTMCFTNGFVVRS